MMQTLAIIGTIVGGYAILYALEFACKLIFGAPSAIYREMLDIAKSAEDHTRILKSENAELRKPRRLPAQQVSYDHAKLALEGMPPHQLEFLRVLLGRDEVRFEDLHQEMIRHHGMSESEWSEAVTFLREQKTHLVDFIHPTPFRPSSYVRIMPQYRDALLELLHAERL